MPVVYLEAIVGHPNYFNMIEFGPGSPPERPHPIGPHPSHPIMLPGMPGWGEIPGFGGPGGGLPIGPGHPDYPTRPHPEPTPPTIPPTPGPGVSAVVIPMPVTDPPTTPPSGMPAGSVQMLVWFGPGTKPASAWVAPYASTGPITPPEGAPVPPGKKAV